MSFHDRYIAHASDPNRSATERIGFVVRYVQPQIASAPFPMVRALGSAEGTFEVWPRPPVGRTLDETLTAHRAFLVRRAALPERSGR